MVRSDRVRGKVSDFPLSPMALLEKVCFADLLFYPHLIRMKKHQLLLWKKIAF